VVHYQQQPLILLACLNYFSYIIFSNYSRLSACGGCQSLNTLLETGSEFAKKRFCEPA
jgi:hypothetical protein